MTQYVSKLRPCCAPLAARHAAHASLSAVTTSGAVLSASRIASAVGRYQTESFAPASMALSSMKFARSLSIDGHFKRAWR
jgi:hypothetical protein